MADTSAASASGASATTAPSPRLGTNAPPPAPGKSPRHEFQTIWDDVDRTIYCLEHVPSTNTVWGGAISGQVVVWNAQTGEVQHVIEAHSYLVFKIHTFRAAGKEWVATCGADNKVVFFNPEAPDAPVGRSNLDKRIYCFLTVDDRLYGAGQNILCYWNLKMIKPNRFPNAIKVPQASDFVVDVRCMLQFGDELWLGNGSAITVFNYKDNTRVESMGGHNSTVNSLILVNDSAGAGAGAAGEAGKQERSVWSGGMDGRINTFLTSTRVRNKLVTDAREGGTGGEINQLVFVEANGVVLAASADSTVKAFTTDGVNISKPLKAHTKHVYCILVVNNTLYSGGDDGVHRWSGWSIPKAVVAVDDQSNDVSAILGAGSPARPGKRVVSNAGSVATPRRAGVAVAREPSVATSVLQQQAVHGGMMLGSPREFGALRRRSSSSSSTDSGQDELLRKLPMEQLYDLFEKASNSDEQMVKVAAAALGRILPVLEYVIRQLQSPADQTVIQASSVLGRLYQHIKEHPVKDLNLPEVLAQIFAAERVKRDAILANEPGAASNPPRRSVLRALCVCVKKCGQSTENNRVALRDVLREHLEYLLRFGEPDVFRAASAALDGLHATELPERDLLEVVRARIRTLIDSPDGDELIAAAAAARSLRTNGKLIRRLFLDGLLTRLVLACPFGNSGPDTKLRKKIALNVDWLLLRLNEAYDGTDSTILLASEAQTLVRKELVILAQNLHPLDPGMLAPDDDPDFYRRKLVNAGAVNGTLRLLSCSNSDAVYDGLRASADLAFVSEFRPLLIKNGAVTAAIRLAAHTDARVCEHSAGLLANLSLVDSQESVQALLADGKATEVLVNLLHTADAKVQQSACLALANFADMLWAVPLEQSGLLIEILAAGTHINKLTEIAQSDARPISMHALRAVGLLCRTPEITQRVINTSAGQKTTLLNYAVSLLPASPTAQSLRAELANQADSSGDMLLHGVAFLGRVCQVHEAARLACAMGVIDSLSATLEATLELLKIDTSEPVLALADILAFALHSIVVHVRHDVRFSTPSAAASEKPIGERLLEARTVNTLLHMLLEGPVMTKLKVLHTLRALAGDDRMLGRLMQIDILRALVEVITIRNDVPEADNLRKVAVQVLSVLYASTREFPASVRATIGPLVSQLYTGSHDSRRYAAWAICYLAESSDEWKRLIVDGGVLMALLHVLSTDDDRRVVHAAVSAVAMLATKNPSSAAGSSTQIAERLADIGTHTALVKVMNWDPSDAEVLRVASAALTFICEYADASLLLRGNILAPLAEHMQHADLQVAANCALCLAFVSRDTLAHDLVMRHSFEQLAALVRSQQVGAEAHCYAVYAVMELTRSERYRPTLLEGAHQLPETLLTLWERPRHERELSRVIEALANLCKDAETAKLVTGTQLRDGQTYVENALEKILDPQHASVSVRRACVRLLTSLAEHRATQSSVLEKVSTGTMRILLDDQAMTAVTIGLLAAMADDQTARVTIVTDRTVLPSVLSSVANSSDEQLILMVSKLLRVLSRFAAQGYQDKDFLSAIVKMLGRNNVETQKNALEAMANLTDKDATNRRASIELGAVERVQSLMKSSMRDPAVLLVLLKVMSKLSTEATARARMLRVGMDVVLVQFMDGAFDVAVRRYSYGIAANLATEDVGGQRLMQAKIAPKLVAVLATTEPQLAPVRSAAVLAVMKLAAKPGFDQQTAGDLALHLIRIFTSETDRDLRARSLTALVYLQGTTTTQRLLHGSVLRVLADCLRGTDVGMQVGALQLLASLCKSEVAATQVLRAGTLADMSRMAASDNAEVQEATGHLYERLTKHQSLRRELLRNDLVNHLILLMRSPHAQAKYRAIKGINYLGKEEEFCRKLVTDNALQPLILLMMDNDRNVQTMATGTLVNITRSRENCMPVLDAGALGTLVSLMLFGARNEIQEYAAMSLVNLSKSHEGRMAIADGGALVPISKAMMAPLKRVRYLCVLAIENISADAAITNKLAHVDVMTPLVAMIEAKDVDIMTNVLRVLINLTAFAPTLQNVVDADVMRVLRPLQLKDKDQPLLAELEDKLAAAAAAGVMPNVGLRSYMSSSSLSAVPPLPKTSPRGGVLSPTGAGNGSPRLSPRQQPQGGSRSPRAAMASAPASSSGSVLAPANGGAANASVAASAGGASGSVSIATPTLVPPTPEKLVIADVRRAPINKQKPPTPTATGRTALQQ